MPSPIRRAIALSEKNVNVRRRPSLKSKDLLISPRKSRRSPGRNSSPKKGAAFAIYEETHEQREANLANHRTMLSRQPLLEYQDENDYNPVKENMYPKKLLGEIADREQRRPLQDLNIEMFPGYVEYADSLESIPLTIPYNDKIRLPNYVTPPRDARIHGYFDNRTRRNVWKTEMSSLSTDDIPKDKVVRKLDFKIWTD